MRSALGILSLILLVPLSTNAQIHTSVLGEDVLVATGGTWDSNLVAVASPEGLVIVDTHDTPAATAEAMATIRSRFPGARVRFVINTHGHDDHVWGNELFAGSSIIAHPKTYEYMAARRDELVPFFSGQRIRDLQEEVDASSGEEAGETRRRLESSKEAHAKWGEVKITLPSMLVEGDVSLRLGERRIEILNLGAAHSEGDLAVFLPGEGILMVGDLVGPPRTMVRLDGEQGDVIGLARALERLTEECGESLRHVVTGHGPVGGRGRLEEAVEYISYLVAEVRKARAKSWNLDTAKEKLELKRLRSFGEFADLRENNVEAAWRSLERRESSPPKSDSSGRSP